MSRATRLRVEPGPGQESVWDYPRPPRVERSHRLVEVASGPHPVARSTRAIRVLETSHPPGWYLPPDDVEAGALRRSDAPSTVCEYKGVAVYWDVVVGGAVLHAVAWSYPEPNRGYETIRDHLAFYPDRLACSIDGERVEPQAGGFYGGWVTADVVGPFKGAPGTWGW